MNIITATTDMKNSLSDADLLKQAQDGDHIAKEQLARACLPRVRRTVLLTTGGGPDVDDLIQNSMARIFVGLKSFASKSSFTTWMDRVTINCVKQYYRRKPLVFLLSGDKEQPSPPASESLSPDNRLEGQRMVKQLAEHLSHIRRKKRIAVVLSAAYGYTAQEIGQLTDCSTETAKKRVQHGRRELLSRLRKDNYLCKVFREN